MEARAGLFDCLERIGRGLAEGRRVELQFDDTNKLVAGGTLYFVACIESLLLEYPGAITSNYPKDEIVCQMLQRIGLLKKLGNGPKVEESADTVRHWHYLEGTTTDVRDLKPFFATLHGQIGGNTSAGLFESISEAVTNVVHHAYEGLGHDAEKSKSRWWLFAQVKDGKLDVAICDRGIGIPKSLRQKPELKDLLPDLFRRFRKRRSSGLIEIAVESARSRTKLPHRGKGLPDMLTFSKQGSVGWFFIMSHHGYFVYNSNFRTEVARDFSPPLDGTLISWQIPVSE